GCRRGWSDMRFIAFIMTLLVALICAPGCKLCHSRKGAYLPHHLPDPPPDMRRELSKVVLPTYTIQPPDILVVEAIHIVPRSPYALRTGDLLAITVQGTLPDAPVSGAYSVQPGGIVNLGAPYGSAKVAGLSPEQAQDEVRRIMAMHVKGQ